MERKEKQLLLQDLLPRLSYGVKCTTKSLWDGIYPIEGYKDGRFFLDCPVYDEGDDEWMVESIVPYLRPLSSMTEEEQKEYHKTFRIEAYGNGYVYVESVHSFDWLNAHHFDYRGLIGKGLALEAPKGMYNIKEK